MQVPFNTEVTITLTNAGGVLETPIVLEAESGWLSGWTSGISLPVVEPEIRLYTRIGQTTGAQFLLPLPFTPNADVDSDMFVTPIPFRNRDVITTTGNNPGVKTTGTGTLYAVCTNGVTTVVTLTLHGMLFIPES